MKTGQKIILTGLATNLGLTFWVGIIIPQLTFATKAIAATLFVVGAVMMWMGK